MGRPLNKKYFGNTVTPFQGGNTGVGGEGLASVALGTAGSGYSQGLTATVDAPAISGGITATVSVAVNPATGAITGYTVTNAGSGYLTAPAVTLVAPATITRAGTGSNLGVTITLASTTGIYVGMQVTGSAGLGTGNAANSVIVSSVDSTTQVTVATAHDGAVSGTLTFAPIGSSGVPGTRALTANGSARPNAIKFEAQVGAGSEVTTGDILRQVSTRRYKVRTSDGTAICKLVATANLNANEMSIVATDVAANTYFVTKLTAHRATLTQIAGGSNYVYATGTSAPWAFAAASGLIVSVANQ